MTRIIMLFFAALVLAGSGAYAAEPLGWNAQVACEAATRRECVINSTKQWLPVTPNATPKQQAKPETTSVSKPLVQAPLATAAKTLLPTSLATASNVVELNTTASQPKAVEVVPSAPPQAEAKDGGGFISRFFGGGEKAPVPDVVARDSVAQPASAVPAVPPRVDPPRPAVDPEQHLRGQVWTSESDCKKEALKGKCSSVDCATHTGGVCSGFTSMIWIYR